MSLLVAVAVLMPLWLSLIYYFELSYAWALLPIPSLFNFWKARTSSNEERGLHGRGVFQYNDEDETSKWLSFLLNRWQVFSSDSIEQLVKELLEEKLSETKPWFLYSLELTTFNTGEQTLSIRNVWVSENCEDVPGPAGLDNMSDYQLDIHCDIQLTSEDFRMILLARVGSGQWKLDTDLVVEKLQVSATLKAVLHLSRDAPFPHFSKVTTSLCKKPDITFSCRLMKVPLMYVPLLNSWIHAKVIEHVTKALKEPISIDLTPAKVGPRKTSKQFMDFLLCWQCGLDITRADNLCNIPSPLALRQRSETLAGIEGVLIQQFKNAQGQYFETISTSKAKIHRVRKPSAEHSWFPGFSWTVAVCPRCGQHLGWVFDPLTPANSASQTKQTPYSDRFISLILGRLLHEKRQNPLSLSPRPTTADGTK